MQTQFQGSRRKLPSMKMNKGIKRICIFLILMIISQNYKSIDALQMPRFRSSFLSMQSSAVIPNFPKFRGEVYIRPNKQWPTEDPHNYQYAESSHIADRPQDVLNPSAIVYPKDVADIILGVNWARATGKKVAVRSGGHQYSAASSTAGDNLLLDLSQTFRGPTDFQVLSNGDVRSGISWELREFNKKLGDLKKFVPHGQCSHVHVGGHCQTGGYGQLGRSFGLFGDHVQSFDIVTADGTWRQNVSKASDPDLFYAVLGGSPGNFGIVTHLTIRPHNDADHPNSRGLKLIHFYDKKRIKDLLDVMVDMVHTPDFPRDFDYCLTVLSASEDILRISSSLDVEMRRLHGEEYGKDEVLRGWPPVIVLYCQWANIDGKPPGPEVQQWFDKIKGAAGKIPFTHFDIISEDYPTPMSTLTKQWIYQGVREFDYPYEKRTYLTKETNLIENGWTEWVSNRIDKIQSDLTDGCHLSIQIQPFGGSQSKYFTNRNEGTSYSWRDSSIVCVMDCFYENDEAQKNAKDWQAANDKEGVGPNGKFSTEDRRVFWGSWGVWGTDDLDLSKSWSKYYDAEDKYLRLRDLKLKYDPTQVFNANPFSIRPTGQK